MGVSNKPPGDSHTPGPCDYISCNQSLDYLLDRFVVIGSCGMGQRDLCVHKCEMQREKGFGG